MRILSIDPGDIESGVSIIQMPEFKLLWFAQLNNENVYKVAKIYDFDVVVIERIASYGMAVGKTVFETCEWIGRFAEQFKQYEVRYIYRREEKLLLCNNIRAKDGNIKQALINRYAKHDFKSGKGTKKNPDTFYGVAKDVWQSIAVGVTYYETKMNCITVPGG